MLTEAFRLQQQGKFDRARAIYESVLEKDPHNFDALHLLGILLATVDDPTGAIELFSKASVLNPTSAHCHLNMGVALRSLGRIEEALACVDRAISIEPLLTQALNSRGMFLLEMGRLEESRASFERAVSIDQRFVEALNNLGVVLLKLGKLGESRSVLEKAVALAPKLPEIWCSLGNTLKEAGKLERAFACFREALSLEPSYAVAHNNAGNSLRALKRPREALTFYKRAVDLDSSYAEAWVNWGDALMEIGESEEALLRYERAVELNPGHALALNNQGVALFELGRFGEAEASYERAASIEPDMVGLHWNLALYHLTLGNLSEGWREFEWRWKSNSIINQEDIPSHPQPLWLGSDPLLGRRILIHAEQGLGDTIQFCRYIPMVAKLGAEIIFEVQPPLVDLLSGLEGVSRILVKGDAVPPCDLQCPLMSLPLAFRTSLNDIPPLPIINSIGEAKLREWQDRLGPRSVTRVGLVWSGNPIHKNDRKRSIKLMDLLPELPAGIEFFCLQPNLRTDERELMSSQGTIRFFGEQIANFTDTAALCRSMDLIISVDTSVAHLSGTLGRPTWVLLPPNADWRWLLRRSDSPWYPSVKLYRTSREDLSWNRIIRMVVADLERLLVQPVPPS